MNCVYPSCPNTSRTRGLCHGHYQTMRSRVRAIPTDAARVALENDLAERGLILAAGTGGTPAPDSRRAFRLGSTVVGRGGHCPSCGCSRANPKHSAEACLNV